MNFLLIAMLSVPTLLFGQLNTPETTKTKFRVSYLGTTFGVIGDHYFGLDFADLESKINDPAYTRGDLENYQQAGSIYTATAGVLGLSARVFKSDLKAKEYHSNYSELYVSAVAVLGQEVMLDYTRSDNSVQETITYCDLSNQFDIQSSYRTGINIEGILNLYTGIGASVGSTFASKFWVFKNRFDGTSFEFNGSTDDELYKAKESFHLRAFIPLGAEIIIKDRIQIGTEFNIGAGMQQVYGGRNFQSLMLGGKINLGIRI